MSKFRCEIDISFSTETEAIAFLNSVEEKKDLVFKGTGNEQIPIIHACRYHECFHDEDPPQQCGNYVNVDFDAATVKHQAKDTKKYKHTDVTVIEDVS